MSTAELTVLETHAMVLVREAQAWSIDSDEDYREASVLLLQMGQISFAWQALHAEAVKTAYTAWKTSVALRDSLPQRLEPSRALLARRLGTWAQAQEHARQTAERAAREEAQLNAAVAAEERGDPLRSEALLNGAEGLPYVLLDRSVPSIEGLSHRERWQARVVDFAALVKAVAEGRAPISLLEVNASVLGGLARSLKSEMQVPGCEVYCEHLVSGRRTAPAVSRGISERAVADGAWDPAIS